METEPKEVVEKTVDQMDDEVLDKIEQETPAGSSPDEETKSVETEPEAQAGDDQQKKSDEPKEKEEAGEEKETEEGKDPRDLAFRKGYNEAKAKADKEREENLKSFPSKEELDSYKTVTTSPAFIRAKMEAQGYKTEAIDAEIKRLGHDVPERTTDDVNLVITKLGIDPKTVNEDLRSTIGDVTKIARVVMEDAMTKQLSTHLKPIQEAQTKYEQRDGATKLMGEMKSQVEKEGVLDFEKDVVPAIDKFVADNKEATQEDVREHFRNISRELSFERLRTGKRKEERDKKKGNLRTNTESRPIGNLKLPVLTGDTDKDDDAILDAMSVPE